MDDENSRVEVASEVTSLVACFLRWNALHIAQYHPTEALPWPTPNPGLTRIGSSFAAASIQPARPMLSPTVAFFMPLNPLEFCHART